MWLQHGNFFIVGSIQLRVKQFVPMWAATALHLTLHFLDPGVLNGYWSLSWQSKNRLLVSEEWWSTVAILTNRRPHHIVTDSIQKVYGLYVTMWWGRNIELAFTVASIFFSMKLPLPRASSITWVNHFF